MEKDKTKYANDNSYPLVRIADAIEEILRLVKKDQEEAKKRWDKEDEQKRRRGEYPRAHKSPAMARGPGPKLQAASNKLQASSSKLDKKEL